MITERITKTDIERVKEKHILRNLLYTPVEAALILAVSVRTVFKLVESGDLRPAGQNGVGRNTRSTRIPAESLEEYRKKLVSK